MPNLGTTLIESSQVQLTVPIRHQCILSLPSHKHSSLTPITNIHPSLLHINSDPSHPLEPPDNLIVCLDSSTPGFMSTNDESMVSEIPKIVF